MRLSFVESAQTMLPHLRSRSVRVILIVTPAITVMAAIATALGPNLAVGVILSTVAGIIVSSSLFIAVGAIAREMADERLLFAHTLEAEQWHVRAQRLFSGHRIKGGLYADWYFRARLEEEIERTTRYNVPFSLLIAKKPGKNGKAKASEWLDETVESHLRRTDLPALLRDGSLGIILPHTAHYKAVCDRLTAAFATAECRVGLAVFPKDGEDGSTLLRAADVAAENATPGTQPIAEPVIEEAAEPSEKPEKPRKTETEPEVAGATEPAEKVVKAKKTKPATTTQTSTPDADAA